MIPARKSEVFRALFVREAERRLSRGFEAVFVRGADAARAIAAAHPVVCVSNHASWWDALVALFVSERVLGTDGYALMEAANLVRFPFFALVGAVGVDRTSAMDGARVVRHVASLLDRPGRLVWIFPQGRERPQTLHPLGFARGAQAVARIVPDARVLPVALRYEPGTTPRPRLFVDVGAALAPDDATVAAQEAAVESLLARSADALANDALADYERVLAAPPSRTQALAEWALAVLTRPFSGVPARLSPRDDHSSRS